MEHMKKSWGKIIKTILGVLVGNLVLSFAVAAFIVPNGIIMGGATGIGLTISHYFQVNLSMIILAINAVLFVLGAVFFGKEVCIDNDHQFLYLSNIPVDGTVHSGNRQSDAG